MDFQWGVGGSAREQVKTSGTGNGWRTNYLPMPNARRIYDGTRPIWIDSLEATAGAGDRRVYYRIANSDLLTSYVHTDMPDNTTFEFRVVRDSGTITLGFKGQSGYATRWLSNGTRITIDKKQPDGIQPGKFDYYLAPTEPRLVVITVSKTTIGRIDILHQAPFDTGGKPVSGYLHQVSRNSAFTNIEAQWESSSVATNRSGLPVGVTLYHRVLAQNPVTDAVGKLGGESSVVQSFRVGQAPTVAPGISVIPAGDGLSATVGLAAPPASGQGGLPQRGFILRREYMGPAPFPSPAYVDTNIPADGSTTTVVYGLAPGATYRWRALSYNEVGNGPNSAWVSILQPLRSIAPGTYFDGSFVDSSDLDYAWTSTPNASTSTVSGYAPTGWAINNQGGGSFRIIRDSGSPIQALITCLVDATGPMVAGLSNSAYYPAVLGSLDYSASMDVLVPRDQPKALDLIWLDAAFAEVGRVSSPTILLTGGVLSTLTVTGTSPVGAAFASLQLRDVSTGGFSPWLSGEQFWQGRAILTLGDVPIAYFDGSTPAAEGFTYAWEGTANLSRSIRSGSFIPTNPLIDPDCVMPPPPPRPPIVPSDCIDNTVDWDRYWYEIPATEVPVWTSIMPQIMIRTNTTTERQIRVRVYADPFGRGLPALPAEAYCGEMVISYLPGGAELVLDSLTQRAWAQVAGGASTSAAHLLYGTEGAPAVFPELSCGTRHYVTVDVPPGGVEGNIDVEVILQGRY